MRSLSIGLDLVKMEEDGDKEGFGFKLFGSRGIEEMRRGFLLRVVKAVYITVYSEWLDLGQERFVC